MAHISSIGAAVFTDLSVAMASTDPVLSATDTAAEFQALFATEIPTTGTKALATFVRVANIRSFPPIGTPANIVKVPTYGAKTSSSIQGQSDAPQLEFDLNFVPSDWTKPATGTYTVGDSLLGDAIGDSKQYVFRFTLLNADSAGVTPATKYASVALGLGTVQNSQYYFVGKMEALLVTPSLTDATTAKLTLSIQSAFFGAYTI